MAKVIMESWREGLEKVSLTKLQNEKLRIPLVKSKSNTDMLLEGNSIVLQIEDENKAREFLEEAERIGVNCKILEQ